MLETLDQKTETVEERFSREKAELIAEFEEQCSHMKHFDKSDDDIRHSILRELSERDLIKPNIDEILENSSIEETAEREKEDTVLQCIKIYNNWKSN